MSAEVMMEMRNPYARANRFARDHRGTGVGVNRGCLAKRCGLERMFFAVVTASIPHPGEWDANSAGFVTAGR